MANIGYSLNQAARVRGRSTFTDRRGGLGGISSGYNGYFKVSDASEIYDDGTRILKVRVEDGSGFSRFVCGYATINNTRFSVDAADITIEKSCGIYLESKISDDGSFEFRPRVIASESPSYSENFSYFLIARVFVNDEDMLEIVQEHHGEIQAIIWGSCD